MCDACAACVLLFQSRCHSLLLLGNDSVETADIPEAHALTLWIFCLQKERALIRPLCAMTPRVVDGPECTQGEPLEPMRVECLSQGLWIVARGCSKLSGGLS
jgi:hypothetical protein